MPLRLLAIVCLPFALPVAAQPHWRVTTWTTGDALPRGVVYAITQTRDGYIWFTTLGGLVRYDGVESSSGPRRRAFAAIGSSPCSRPATARCGRAPKTDS